MCGIAAVASFSPGDWMDVAWAMSDALVHRRGDQPKLDERHRLCVVLKGEIYDCG